MTQTLHGFHHIVELELLSKKLSFLSSNNKNKKEKSNAEQWGNHFFDRRESNQTLIT